VIGAQRFPRRPGPHHVELWHQLAPLTWREQFQRGPERTLDLEDRGLARALHGCGDQRTAAFHHQSHSSEWRYDFEHSSLAVNELLEAPLHWFVIADLLHMEAGTLRLNAEDRSKPQFA
jgi:hypothetical protein